MNDELLGGILIPKRAMGSSKSSKGSIIHID
jgi:hypothetical protein